MAYSADSKIKVITNCGVQGSANGYEIVFVAQEVASGKYLFLHASTPAGGGTRIWQYKTKSWADNYNTGASDGLRIDPSLDYSGFLNVNAPDFVSDATTGQIPVVNIVNDTGTVLRDKLNTARNIVNFTLFGDGITSNPFASTAYTPAVSNTGTTATTGTISTFTSSITDFVTNNPLTSVLIGAALGFGVYWAWKEGVFESKKKKRRR